MITPQCDCSTGWMEIDSESVVEICMLKSTKNASKSSNVQNPKFDFALEEQARQK